VLPVTVLFPIVVNFLFSAVWRHRSELAVYNEMSSSAEAEGGSGQWSMVMSAPQMMKREGVWVHRIHSKKKTASLRPDGDADWNQESFD